MKSDDPEILLTFAHYGEAGAFIREKGFQPLDFCDNGLYESSNTLLLLTGEGISSTMERLSAVCREFKHHISEVINLGIAGSLSKELNIGEIYSIRSVIREPHSGKRFETYLSAETRATADCITAGKRVLDDDYARRLAGFAQLADRELWAVAAVCAQFQLPFRSYKLISDMAGKNTHPGEIKRRAREYSIELYQFYSALQQV
jgi:nucleoside phosphorylase